MTPDEYLDWIVTPAKAVCGRYDLPYQVCVAQGAIESEWGKYGLGNGGYNIFGRKWGGEGEYVEKETQECYDGVWQTITAKFQSYACLEDAIKDWCILITEEPVYAPCLEYRYDIEQFVRTMGPVYATDPAYADKILLTIRACELT